MVWTIIAVIIGTCIAATNYQFGHSTNINRPIFIGFVMGLLLGDMKTGILVGAELELAFLGISQIGWSTAADPELATICTVAFAITNGMPINTAIPLGVTIGYAASSFRNAAPALGELFVPWRKEALGRGDGKAYYLRSVLSNVVCEWCPRCIIGVTGVLLGGPVLEAFVNNLPPFVLNGINAAGAMLPALGICMILVTVFNRQVAVYFFAGFAVYKYLQVDMMFCLIIGLVIAFITFSISAVKNKSTVSVAAAANTENEEEDFLS